jgi:hypothetical protein
VLLRLALRRWVPPPQVLTTGRDTTLPATMALPRQWPVDTAITTTRHTIVAYPRHSWLHRRAQMGGAGDEGPQLQVKAGRGSNDESIMV